MASEEKAKNTNKKGPRYGGPLFLNLVEYSTILLSAGQL